MKNRKLSTVVWIFWIVTIAGCIASEFGYGNIDLFLKPLLMPLLIVMIFISVQKGGRPVVVVAGLIFPWMGDVFLMFDQNLPIFFIFGLVAFLITHLCYIVYFLNIGKGNSRSSKYFWAIPVFGYSTLLVWALYPDLGSMAYPVIGYAAVISLMLLSVLWLPSLQGLKVLFVMGALWFVLSDSALAINKFAFSFPFSSTLIRFSYSLAQFLIVYAVIRYKNSEAVVNLGI